MTDRPKTDYRQLARQKFPELRIVGDGPFCVVDRRAFYV
jgi:hypothetical protein